MQETNLHMKRCIFADKIAPLNVHKLPLQSFILFCTTGELGRFVWSKHQIVGEYCKKTHWILCLTKYLLLPSVYIFAT